MSAPRPRRPPDDASGWESPDHDGRGVSEVISFTLIFALIGTVVAVISVVGFTGLEDSRDDEQLQNAQRAFDVLADNMADIYREGAPSRATEIKLNEASMYIGDTSTFFVDVPGGPSLTFTPQPIVYETERSDSKVVYEAGAVLRVDGDSAVMLNEPPMQFDEGRSILTVVSLTNDGADSVGGTTTVLVRAAETGNTISYPQGSGNPDVNAPAGSVMTVRFATTPARAGAWERFFEEEFAYTDEDECETDSSGTVTCTLEEADGDLPDELYVSKSTISVTFS